VRNSLDTEKFTMTKSALLASTAIALLLCSAPATAQMQQKESAPSQREPAQQKEQGSAPSRSETGQDKSESKEKGSPQGKSKDQPGKGTAQTEPKDKASKGTAEKSPEPKDKSTKGTAEKGSEPKEKAKGTTEKAAEPKDKASKGTAEKSPEPKDKGTAEKGAQPKDKAAGADSKEKSGSTARVQLSEQQRTNVHQTILKDRNVNRVTNVNFSINVGTRIPRSVKLAALSASVIAIVPEYRSYRYFVVDDRICIVDPNSYEIVEIITVSGQTAAREDRGGSAKLVLTEEEKTIILREVDLGGGSTLGLGAINEGADVPREVEVRAFPDTVVQRVPKVKGYKFFTAENRLAIVDPQGARVQLVIEARR
jgi:hypothetical protein